MTAGGIWCAEHLAEPMMEINDDTLELVMRKGIDKMTSSCRIVLETIEEGRLWQMPLQ